MRRLLLLVLLALAALPVVPASAASQPGFGWPLPVPVVDRRFEPPATAYGTGHRGVDLRGTVGELVLAAGSGRVSYAGLLAGRGVVTVTHDGGLRTTYEPIAATVRVGQLVARGAALGKLTAGHASCRTGTACLHWGLLRGATYLDPLSLLAAGPVRLLPLGAPGAATAASPIPLQVGPLQVGPLQVAAPTRRQGWTGAGRSLGALTATGALLAGVGLLARRPGVPGPAGPAPGAALVDLRLERRRRRAA